LAGTKENMRDDVLAGTREDLREIEKHRTTTVCVFELRRGRGLGRQALSTN
jgi:hypothetical protein